VFYEFKRIIIYFVAKVKEKTMANRNFWLGILVMVLIFGMTVVGCDDSSTNGGNNDAKKITITDLTGKTGGIIINVVSANGLVAQGMGAIANNSVTVSLATGLLDPWTGSGSYYLNLYLDMDSCYYGYTNGKTWSELGISSDSSESDIMAKTPKYNISSTISTISFSQFQGEPEW
jgi:hypothetical protein